MRKEEYLQVLIMFDMNNSFKSHVNTYACTYTHVRTYDDFTGYLNWLNQV